MNKILVLLCWLLVLCGSALFMAGCSSKPVAVSSPTYSQTKLRSVDHWDTLASVVADRVVLTYEKRNDLIARPVVIERPNNKPFSVAFESLLRTQLVTRGMQVEDTQTHNAVVLGFSVQVVLHSQDYRDWIPTLADLGIAVANFFTGKYTSSSQHEIIVNSFMVQNNRYAMHFSTTHYIDDDDWMSYGVPGASHSQYSSVPNEELWKKHSQRQQSF